MLHMKVPRSDRCNILKTKKVRATTGWVFRLTFSYSAYLQLYPSNEQSKVNKCTDGLNSNALWMVEMEKPNRGGNNLFSVRQQLSYWIRLGIASYGGIYRLKHVATGKYLRGMAKAPKPFAGKSFPFLERNKRKKTPFRKESVEVEEDEESPTNSEASVGCTFTTTDGYSNNDTLFTIHQLSHSYVRSLLAVSHPYHQNRRKMGRYR